MPLQAIAVTVSFVMLQCLMGNVVPQQLESRRLPTPDLGDHISLARDCGV
ncbi:unnamed protein product [Staurois parvus]|uniref:Uncharacterized protein n=1 Tax=Staurois parvus TaxID=386267 RepID=A0ABN9GBM4_9NEOB|nr:unnamed protein product [Staurois parvus]